MKAPSKNISNSLRGQSPPGRGAESVQVGKLKGYSPSMTLPGEGKTSMAPGTHARDDGRQERSASVYAGVVGSKVGG
ncbi:MAG TPA: hypothetical protein VL614_14970 [Acetobacteraceae bacterium]|jgi:hypothetical protein|nr:hypothetical protein [Acetobacteraceae bacterium]